jgi:hypothetical protein
MAHNGSEELPRRGTIVEPLLAGGFLGRRAIVGAIRFLVRDQQKALQAEDKRHHPRK